MVLVTSALVNQVNQVPTRLEVKEAGVADAGIESLGN
jgi:hypothetical protein